MKKILFCLMICLLLVGCNNKKGNEDVVKENILGGITYNLETTRASISEETYKIFESAYNNYKDMKLEVIAYLGSQVVAGSNHMFLCKTSDSWKVAIIYKDLEGNATITKVVDFNVLDFNNENGTEEGLAGGWTVYYEDYYDNGLREESKKAFEDAIKDYTGLVLSPLAEIGTQVVSGTNYYILCAGRVVYPDAKYNLYLVKVYSSLENTNEIIDVYNVNLKDFNK